MSSLFVSLTILTGGSADCLVPSCRFCLVVMWMLLEEKGENVQQLTNNTFVLSVYMNLVRVLACCVLAVPVCARSFKSAVFVDSHYHFDIM